MSHYTKVPIERDELEYSKIIIEVRRRIDIFKSKGLIIDVEDVPSFVQEFFFLSEGQRIVSYDHVLNYSSVRDKILISYPKEPIIRNVVRNEVVVANTDFSVSVPFGLSEPARLQPVAIAPKGSEYDLAVEVVGTRRIETHTIEEVVCALDVCESGVLDVIVGPDDISKKPYHVRRDFLKKHSIKIAPETTELRKAILIKDSSSYNGDIGGGYFRFTTSEELDVLRKVQHNVCQYMVRGSLVDDSLYTIIASEDVVEENSESRVRRNMKTGEIIGTAIVLNDIVDYYTMRYSLPQELSDVAITRRLEDHPVLVDEIRVVVKGQVQSVGMRKRLYTLLSGMKVRLKIRNTKEDVVIEGCVLSSMISSVRFRIENFLRVNDARMIWEVLKSNQMKSVEWMVTIEL